MNKSNFSYNQSQVDFFSSDLLAHMNSRGASNEIDPLRLTDFSHPSAQEYRECRNVMTYFFYNSPNTDIERLVQGKRGCYSPKPTYLPKSQILARHYNVEAQD
jgi:hypothetical protein